MKQVFFSPFQSQLELGFPKFKEPDRNYHKGGRSFYFFDLDDNVFFLTTNIYLFHKKTGKQKAVSTGNFAHIQHEIGKQGIYRDFELRYCAETGSFRRFRDVSENKLNSVSKKNQPFIEDIYEALGKPDFYWKGPSWNFFHHAVFNNRPLSLITARGHHPNTLIHGIDELRKSGHLSHKPNFLGVFPLNHPDVRSQLGDQEMKESIPVLKKKAIIASVQMAMSKYGENEHHRFGMSDDDAKNIELIIEAMIELKREFPKNSFFVIDSRSDKLIKEEVFLDHVKKTSFSVSEQLALY